MVQLPATTAIEYVEACCQGALFPRGSFGRGDFWPGEFLSGGAFVRGAYARSPQVQCVLAYTYRLGFLCLAS